MNEIWKQFLDLRSPSGTDIGEMTIDWKEETISIEFDNVGMMKSFLQMLEDLDM